MKQLELENGGLTLVDNDVYEWAQHFKWYRDHYGYACRNAGYGRKGRHTLLLHREIIKGVPTGFVRDHINGDRLDNRRKNLRVVSRTVNNLNSNARTGVIQHQGKWRVRFVIKKQRVVDISGIETEAEARSISRLIRGALVYYYSTEGGEYLGE